MTLPYNAWLPGTPVTLNSASTPAFTITGLASTGWRQSAKVDLGAGSAYWAAAYVARLSVKVSTGGAALAGTTLKVYVGYSGSATAATDNPGGCSGADASYAGYASGTATQSAIQLDLIGVHVLDNQAATPAAAQVSPEFPFVPKQRYGCFVVYNGSGQALTSTDDTNNFLLLTPLQQPQETY